MDETMICQWNSVVQPNDTVYHVGDFTFYGDPDTVVNILKRLNGHKVLIRGNHDKIISNQEVRNQFVDVFPIHEIYIQDPSARGGKQHIVLCHYAMKVWNKSHHGSWQLFGHSHGSIPDPQDALQMDVGVDCHNFTPINYDQVKTIMSKKTFKPIDHHGKDA